MYSRLEECKCPLFIPSKSVLPPLQITTFVGKPGCTKLEGLQLCKKLNGIAISNSFIFENFEKEVQMQVNQEKFQLLNTDLTQIQTSCIENYVQYSYCFQHLRKKGKLCGYDERRYLEDDLMNFYLNSYKMKFQDRTNVEKNSKIKIAYIILIQTIADLTINLIKTLYTPNSIFVVHADVKMSPKELNNLKEEFQSFSNVYFLENRFNVNPEGISVVYAELSCLLYLLHMNVNWDYVINLSETSFPIKKTEEIESILTRESNSFTKNFMVYSILDEKSNKISKVTNYYTECNYYGIQGSKPKPIQLFQFNNSSSNLPKLYIGTQWFVLTKSFCEYVANFGQLNEYLSFFHTTHQPHELFFTTILMNSPFSQTIDERSWHYIAYGRNNQKLWSLDIPSFNLLEQFFVRKILTPDVQLDIIKWLKEKN